MRGHREDKRRQRLSAQHRCWECAELLAFDDISRFHYCARCRATADAEVWRLHAAGRGQADIATATGRAVSTVCDTIHRLTRAQVHTGDHVPRGDDLPRCRCGLRIDKDHLVCDLYGASQFANQRRGAGPTYPGNGWRGDD